MFTVDTNRLRNLNLPTDHSGCVAWMSCFQPDARYHQMKLKSQGKEVNRLQ